jgi:hypothetical protein
MKTLDCILGLSLIAASPAAPTKPSPIPAPAPARPKANPAPISLAEPPPSEAPDDVCAYTGDGEPNDDIVKVAEATTIIRIGKMIRRDDDDLFIPILINVRN